VQNVAGIDAVVLIINIMRVWLDVLIPNWEAMSTRPSKGIKAHPYLNTRRLKHQSQISVDGSHLYVSFRRGISLKFCYVSPICAEGSKFGMGVWVADVIICDNSAKIKLRQCMYAADSLIHYVARFCGCT